MMKKLLFVLTVLICSLEIKAGDSMRDCMLLPITDGQDNSVGFKIFEEIEYYIKDSAWCDYKSNSELINILGEYSNNLQDHLNNKDVLKVVAEKTKAGSLIKVNLKVEPRNTYVNVEVIGDNGEDLYFREKTLLNTNDERVISQTIKNWLELYEKTIPYRGKVKGVLGDQFTIDLGKKSKIFEGSELTIVRAMGKRQHPLLKEIIDYQTEKIATAKVFDVNDSQAQAKVLDYTTNKKLQIGDWVLVKKRDLQKVENNDPFNESAKNSIGTLGSVGFYLGLGSSQLDQSSTRDKTADGMMISADVKVEAWATRNYFAGLELGKAFGKYSKDSGEFANDKNSTTNSSFRLMGGYRYLPLGYFYGPQVDFYGGFAKYTYDLKNNVADKLQEVSFSGVMLGAKANLPIYERLRAFVNFDFLLTNSFSQKLGYYGNDSSSSTYRVGFGTQYIYATNMSYSLGLEILKNKAEFDGPGILQMQFSDVSVKVGAIFTF